MISLVRSYRNLLEHIHLHPFPHPNQQEDLLISCAMPLLDRSVQSLGGEF